MTLKTASVWALIDDHSDDIAASSTSTGEDALSALALEFHTSTTVCAAVVVSIRIEGEEMSSSLRAGRHVQTASSVLDVTQSTVVSHLAELIK